jgi:hypothetical protein
VTLSSTQAKYAAISEAIKEVKFVYYLLRDLQIKVNLPILVRTDNIGAIIMLENASTDFRTRHVDTHYHFVREFIEDGFIRIEFIRSAENDSDCVLVRSCMRGTQTNFWKSVKITVLVDCYRIGRVLKISLTINHLALYV